MLKGSMLRALCVLCGGFPCVALFAGVTLTARPVQNPPSFVSESSELVVLPVTVLDNHGRLISDLPVERFVVYDNGRRQAIALFSNEDTPVTVGLILDASRSMAPKLGKSSPQRSASRVQQPPG